MSFRLLITLASLIALSACSHFNYYRQAISGHLEIMHKRQPLSELLTDPKLDADLRRRLQLAQQARDFAVKELHLPDNQSYRSYTDLDREYVSWTVIATPEFAVEPHQWCFLIVGCLPYRGYFSAAAAQTFADQRRQLGDDVFIGGASAYSTLGWFDDPLLSSMLQWQDTRLIGVIFHELAHQQVWLEGDATFNESFAVFVEHTGVRQWLQQHGDSQQLADYNANLMRQKIFIAELQQTRAALAELFASDLSPAEKRISKQNLFDAFQRTYWQQIRPAWNGYSGYDAWFTKELNNARFALIATYHDWLPAFEKLFIESDSDFQKFYARVKALGKLSANEREARLTQLQNNH